ncbi:hypothetical protein GOBAR_AA03195 [Gossypium barbadense]|uniref:Uncharacterized protein n=1 Tax=Gossypium barbadense TaxID=3634 RepID=A0A2P5YP86_GOSBA|nr:hypothetical protein GOBAR_AA03195 [Gossypium barbadense]
MVQPTLQEISLKEAHELFLNNNRGPIQEDQRLQIEELDEWRTHKPKTPDKSNLQRNELNTFPNQLKVGDRVLLDAADPHIVTTIPNEEIPLTVLSIFPLGTVEVSHSKFGTFKHGCETRSCLAPVVEPVRLTRAWEKRTTPDTVVRHDHFKCRIHEERRPLSLLRRRGRERRPPRVQPRKFVTISFNSPKGPRKNFSKYFGSDLLITGHYIDWATVEQIQLADAIWALLTTDPWELFFGIIKSTYLELTMELCSTFHLQTVMTNYDDPGTV